MTIEPLDEEDVRFCVNEAKWGRVSGYLTCFMICGIVALGYVTDAFSESLSLPLLWIAYFAAATLGALAAASVSAWIFKKSIVVHHDRIEVRRKWRTRIWNLDRFDGMPKLELRLQGGYYDLTFPYRNPAGRASTQAKQPGDASANVSIPLSYVDKASSRQLLEVLKLTVEKRRIAQHRVDFLQRQEHRKSGADLPAG